MRNILHQSTLAIITLCTTAGCLSTTAPKFVEPERHTLTVAGHQRTYVVAPDVGTQPAKRPLLLVYHGAGGTADGILLGTNLGGAGVKAGMIVVALDAVAGSAGRWATNPADLAVVDDVEFSRQVVADVAKKFPVDTTQVYAVGYSRGGDFVYQLACRAPKFARAVAAVSATTLYTSQEWCEASANQAVHPQLTIVLGTQDPIMPWDGGLPNRMGGPQTAAYWAARYNCGTQAPTQTPVAARAGYQVTALRYGPCARGAVTLYRVEPLAHDWASLAFDVESTLVNEFRAIGGW